MSGTSPSTAFSPPQLLGNSSYQALKRALTRSTSIGIGLSSEAAPSRSCVRSMTSKSSGPSARSNLSCIGLSGSSSAATASSSVALSSPLAFSSTRWMKSTPSLTSLLRSSSRSASTLRRSSSCQVAQRSVQASKLSCQVPCVSTVNSPAQRTPLMWASTWCRGHSSHRLPPGALYFTTAFSFSWPSRKMSADTATVSPTVRLTAYRPLSRTGAGFAILIRLGRSLRFGAGISAVEYPELDHMNLSRSSGVLLHPTSLPSGRLGPEAYAWVDWLAAAGQSWWQMLPLGPPDEHGSPYKSASAFAAWPGLLAEPSAPVSASERMEFRERSADWIEDWIAFAGPEALDDQVRFDREWGALRAFAEERGVRLIGDAPIYVADGSADALAHPEILQQGAVAGVPPDAFTDDGQLWGNPLYDWPALQRRRYAWWTARFRRMFELFDLVRIDHFRAFTAYWAVPADAKTAAAGQGRRGPGRAPFGPAARAPGGVPPVAGGLGGGTGPVETRPGARAVRARGACARRAAPDRGGPGGDHAAGQAAARVAGAAGNGGDPVRLHAVGAQHAARARAPRAAPGRLHRHPRQGHDPLLG